MFHRNIQSESNCIDEARYHFIYSFRKNIPRHQLFYLVIIFLKFISMADLTQNVSELESKGQGLNHLITRLYVISHFKCKVLTYKFISLFVVIALITLICLLFYCKKRFESLHVKSSSIERLNKPTYLLRALTYAVVAVSTVSQHLIELLFVGVIITLSTTAIDSNAFFTDAVNLQNNWQIQITCAMNSVSIVIIEAITMFFFYFASSPTFQTRNGFNTLLNGIYYSMLMLMSLTQGIASTSQWLHVSQKRLVNIIMCFLMSGYNAVCLFICYRQFIYSAIGFMNEFFHLFIFISGVTEIFLFYLSSSSLTIKVAYLKTATELLNALLFLVLITRYKHKTLLKDFPSNVFSESKKLNFKSIVAFIHLLNNTSTAKRGLYQVYDLFITHSDHCTLSNCPCKAIGITPSDILQSNQSRAIETFTIIAEHEIVKQLIRKIKAKQPPSSIQSLILFHLGFIASIKKSQYLALYLSQSYLSDKRASSYSFKTRYTLYEYQKEIIREIKSICPQAIENLQQTEGNLQLITAKLYKKSNKLKKYILLIEKIKFDLLETCEKLESFFFLKNKELLLIGATEQKCKEFVGYVKGFNDMDEGLRDELLHNFSLARKLKNKELIFLLANYYQLVYRAIPEEIDELFNDTISPTQLLKDSVDFEEMKAANPMIISINNKDIFSVKYISQMLCNALAYKKQDLINEDFKVLLPKLTGQIHSLFMKQFCLSGIHQIKKTTFLIDREGRMVPVSINANIFPNLSGILSLIINSSLPSPDKTKPYQLEYHFLLDKHFTVCATNEAFEEFFFVNKQILELLSVSFCSFFSLNRDHLDRQFHEAINAKRSAKKYSIEEINRAISIMSTCKMENMLHCRKKKQLEAPPSDFLPIQSITKSISYSELSNAINRMENEVEDFGYDTEFNSRMLFFRERLRITSSSRPSSQDENSLAITISLKMISSLIYFKAVIKETIFSIDRVRANYRAFISPNYYNEGGQITYGKDFESPSNSLQKQKSFVSPSHSLQKQKSIMPPANFSLLRQGTISRLPIESKKSSRCINLIETSSALALMDTKSQLNCNSINLLSTKLESQPIKSNKSSKRIKASSKVRTKRLCCLTTLAGLNTFFSVLILFSLISSCVIAVFFIQKSKKLFIIFAYSTLTSGDLSFCSLNIMSNCFNADALHPQMKIANDWLLGRQDNEMNGSFYIIRKYLSLLAADTEVLPVLDIINQEITLKYIYEDYQIKERVSSIWEEILFLHYLINSQMLLSSEEHCRVQSLFFNEHFKSNRLNPIATNKEKMLFYLIYNVLPVIRTKLFEIINEALKAVLNYNEFLLRLLQCFNLAIIGLIVLLYSMFLIQLCIRHGKLKRILNSLLKQRPGEENFEEELKHFKNVINDFDSTTVTLFESFKAKAHIAKQKSTNFKPSPNRSSSSMSLKKGKNQGKSQFIGHSTTNALNNETYNTKEKKRNTFHHNFAFFYYIITVIMLSINLTIQVTDFFFTFDYFHGLKLQARIGFNFLQRIPTLVDLTLYYLTSIIMNDEDYIKRSNSSSMASELFNYYSIVIEEDKDSLMNRFNTSYYSELDYNLQLQRGNIFRFMKTNEGGIFSVVSTLESQFNTANDFIPYLSFHNASIYFSQNDLNASLRAILEEINDYGKVVRTEGNRINSNGLNAVIDFMLQELNTNFLSYFSMKEAHLRNQTEFIADKDIVLIVEGIQMTLNGVYNTYSQMIVDDMLSTYDNTLKDELWLFSLSLISHILFSLIMILLVLPKLQKTEMLFTKTKRILLNAIEASTK